MDGLLWAARARTSASLGKCQCLWLSLKPWGPLRESAPSEVIHHPPEMPSKAQRESAAGDGVHPGTQVPNVPPKQRALWLGGTCTCIKLGGKPKPWIWEPVGLFSTARQSRAARSQPKHVRGRFNALKHGSSSLFSFIFTDLSLKAKFLCVYTDAHSSGQGCSWDICPRRQANRIFTIKEMHSQFARLYFTVYKYPVRN